MSTPAIGFRNGDAVCKNITFDYTTNPQLAQPGVITQDGQLLIGSIVTNHNIAMSAGNLISPGNTVTIGYVFPNITLDVAGGSSGIITLTGNTGGAQPAIAGNFDVQTSNTTVVFAGSPGQQIQDFGLSNLLLGANGSSITSAVFNTSLGASALQNLTSGVANITVGNNAGMSITTGNTNVIIGVNSAPSMSTSSDNTFIGTGTGFVIASGTGKNVAIGSSSLGSLISGVSNIAIGYASGNSLSGSESSNIYLSSTGVVGDNNTIRLGTQGSGAGQQNRAFAAGIYNVTVAASQPVGIASTGQLNTLGFGTTGQVLTSSGSGVSPIWSTPASSVLTVTGNTGGAQLPDGSGNFNVLTANTTLKFAGTTNTETLDFGISNLLLGANGSSITSAAFNSGVGLNALQNLTSGFGNIAIGYNAGAGITTGSTNVFIGAGSGQSIATSSDNMFIGALTGSLISSGTGKNVAIGSSSLGSLSSGVSNIAIGYASGGVLSGSESSNIYLSSTGVVGDNNTIRLGTQGSGAGQQNRAFAAGIYNVTVAASQPVAIASTGQLNTLGFGTSGQVLTSTGASSTPTWQAASSGTITLTPDIGVAVNPVSNNINVLGLPILPTQTVSLQTQTYNDTSGGQPNLRIKAPNCCLFIVDANPLYGTHTTIQSAVNDAAALGTTQYVFIRPGTYTENISLPNRVSLVNYASDPYSPKVIIIGSMTVGAGAAVSITGIQLQNTSGSLITLTAGTIFLTLFNCTVFPNGTAGFVVGSTCNLILDHCTGNLQNTNACYFTITGSGGNAGAATITDCALANSIASAVQNTVTDSNLNMFNTRFEGPITTSGTCALQFSTCEFKALNTPCLNSGANISSAADIYGCEFNSGTGACLTLAANNFVYLQACVLSSTGASAITGAGTLNYTPITFSGLTTTITVTTQQPLGAVGPRFRVGSLGLHIMSGSGTPNGIVTALQGSLFLRSDGSSTSTRAYINTNGASAWTAITTAT